MNIYLYKFFESEILENSYYDAIREYASKKSDTNITEVIEDIVDEYDDWGEQGYGPYAFIDGIENFLRQAEEEGKDITSYSSMIEIVGEWSIRGY